MTTASTSSWPRPALGAVDAKTNQKEIKWPFHMADNSLKLNGWPPGQEAAMGGWFRGRSSSGVQCYLEGSLIQVRVRVRTRTRSPVRVISMCLTVDVLASADVLLRDEWCQYNNNTSKRLKNSQRKESQRRGSLAGDWWKKLEGIPETLLKAGQDRKGILAKPAKVFNSGKLVNWNTCTYLL